MSKRAVGGSQPSGAYSPAIIAEGRLADLAGPGAGASGPDGPTL